MCTSAVCQHTTPCASVRKWNSCNPNQISSSQPQRSLKLLKVPDLHLHLLSFQDRIKSYSHLQGRREGGEFAPSEQQQPHPCTRLRGCVALRVRWRLDTPGSSLLAVSFSWMKLSARPVAPWALPAAKEQIHRRLGCICVLPVNTVPFGRRGAMCSRAVSPFGTEQPPERHSRFQGQVPKQDMASPHTFTHAPHPIASEAPSAMCGTHCKPALLRGLLPSEQVGFPRKGGSPASWWHGTLTDGGRPGIKAEDGAEC